MRNVSDSGEEIAIAASSPLLSQSEVGIRVKSHVLHVQREVVDDLRQVDRMGLQRRVRPELVPDRRVLLNLRRVVGPCGPQLGVEELEEGVGQFPAEAFEVVEVVLRVGSDQVLVVFAPPALCEQVAGGQVDFRLRELFVEVGDLGGCVEEDSVTDDSGILCSLRIIS